MKRDVHTDYDTWEKKYVTSSGLLRKYICEELKIDTILYSWLNRFAETYPEKLLLLHFNGEARQVNDYPEKTRNTFPGTGYMKPAAFYLKIAHHLKLTFK